MNRLMIRLYGVLEDENQDSINYQIANTLVTQMASIRHTSTSALAKLCNVSKPSISRFCKNLGYEDFYDFRAELNQYCPDWGMKYQMPEKQVLESNIEIDIGKGCMSKYLNIVEQNLSKLRTPDFLEQLELLVKDIHDYPFVSLMGNMQSGSTASNLYYNLHVCKKNISAATGLKEQTRVFEETRRDRLIVIFSVSGEYFRALFPVGEVPKQALGSKVWMVTTNPAIRRIDSVDAFLNCGTGSDLASSNICLELVAELIAGCYWNRYQ